MKDALPGNIGCPTDMMRQYRLKDIGGAQLRSRRTRPFLRCGAGLAFRAYSIRGVRAVLHLLGGVICTNPCSPQTKCPTGARGEKSILQCRRTLQTEQPDADGVSPIESPSTKITAAISSVGLNPRLEGSHTLVDVHCELQQQSECRASSQRPACLCSWLRDFPVVYFPPPSPDLSTDALSL